MTTKIGLISDLHASVKPVREALDIFKAEQVDLILCAGDIAGYGDELEDTINLLKASECISVMGNHEEWYVEKNTNSETNGVAEYFNTLPCFKKLSIENKSLYLVHAEPPEATMGGIRLLDKQGGLVEQQLEEWHDTIEELKCDVLIVGHTHQVFAVTIGETMVINPGSSAFNHSCAILKIPEMEVDWFSLSGKAIEKTWNWSDQFSANRK